MATKKELEQIVADLESDVKVLIKALEEIHNKAKSVDFNPSPVLEKSPAYLLGAIQSMSRFAPMSVRTVTLKENMSRDCII